MIIVVMAASLVVIEYPSKLLPLEGRAPLTIGELNSFFQGKGRTILMEKGKLSVYLGSNHRVIFFSKRGNRIVRFKVDLTTNGLAVFLIMLVFFYITPFALPISIYWRIKVREFIRSLDQDEIRATVADFQNGVDSNLVQGLSEALRISVEAARSVMSNFANNLFIAFILGIVLWMCTLPLLINGDRQTGIIFLLLSIAIWGGISVYGLISFDRSRVREREFSLWSDRLQMAIFAETSPFGGKEASSSLELLLAASSQMPRMLVIGRPSFSEKHPVMALVLLIITLSSFSTLPVIAMNGVLVIQIIGYAAIFLVLGLEWTIYRRLAKADDLEIQEYKKVWAARQAKLQSDFDDLLERG
jgi:hypothetical protein